MADAVPAPPAPSVSAWLAAFAAELGEAAPTAEEIDQLLALAGVAARGSARQAAPVACWMAARAGVPLTDALAAARRVPPSSTE
jgi:hypothetical protein